ncbi:hypothetical protein MLD38_033658 [Melastoma candidum]|uniref:Uncharacterized protein n=1 Tax=Melastoma candidum TaxID=119954 RepID=A0ACB9M817_9MYRT|nr:hypothetical protein MLD38_033658 [Melastoma candidum]
MDQDPGGRVRTLCVSGTGHVRVGRVLRRGRVLPRPVQPTAERRAEEPVEAQKRGGTTSIVPELRSLRAKASPKGRGDGGVYLQDESIVRPEALNTTLINVVHHFLRLKQGFDFVDVDRGMMVINHYKYQVWEVFKEKFYRRVATYVPDWKDRQNVGSKDRAPGLGTKAVEPPDWSTRFCEVNDTGLRDRVLRLFAEPGSTLLPWKGLD